MSHIPATQLNEVNVSKQKIVLIFLKAFDWIVLSDSKMVSLLKCFNFLWLM